MWELLSGWLGEKCITAGLFIGLDGQSYLRTDNIILRASDGTTQIDHIVVSRFGIFVIETKNLHGDIYGHKDDAVWTNQGTVTAFTFQNPLRQNYRHIKTLQELSRLPPHVFFSIIYFVGNCRLMTPLPANVRQEGLIQYIAQHQKPLITEESVPRIHNWLQVHKGQISHAEHMASLQERHQAKEPCPYCGKNLVLRHSKTGHPFVGCSGYPNCRYLKNLNE